MCIAGEHARVRISLLFIRAALSFVVRLVQSRAQHAGIFIRGAIREDGMVGSERMVRNEVVLISAHQVDSQATQPYVDSATRSQAIRPPPALAGDVMSTFIHTCVSVNNDGLERLCLLLCEEGKGPAPLHQHEASALLIRGHLAQGRPLLILLLASASGRHPWL